PVPPPEFTFEIATHNVLGASHTSGKGRRGFAGAETRMGYTVGLLNGYGVDVVGFQELQSSQYHMFSSRMPGFGVYPGPAAGPLGYENSIAWRESMFSLVDSYTIGVPYFGGRIRPMPVIRLKEETTGREFFVANFHNPADTHGAAGHWRAAATSIQIGLINRLQEESGLPVFITGDMNERESYFCRVTASTGIASASGGGTGSPCLAPPGPVPVDWILATTDVEITAFHDVRTGIITRTSDHPLLVATALLAQ
ncbi:MAG: endonuclease/exonuclease/phosphatase family protein, partial [Nocardioides sp.]